MRLLLGMRRHRLHLPDIAVHAELALVSGRWCRLERHRRERTIGSRSGKPARLRCSGSPAACGRCVAGGWHLSVAGGEFPFGSRGRCIHHAGG